MPQNPELDALASEAAAMTGKPAVEAVAESGPDTAAQLQPAVAMAFQRLGNALAERAKVTPLEEGEADGIAGALLNVAKVYGYLDRADPKIMAWLTLGGVTVAVIANRRPLPPPPAENAAAQ